MKQNNKIFSENLKKRIYAFILKLIKLIEHLPRYDALCQVVRDQLMRSGTSIGANYIEAVAASSKKDFTNFLTYSLKSANESKFWLALLRDTGKIETSEANKLLKELIEIASILGSSVRTLKRQ